MIGGGGGGMLVVDQRWKVKGWCLMVWWHNVVVVNREQGVGLEILGLIFCFLNVKRKKEGDKTQWRSSKDLGL